MNRILSVTAMICLLGALPLSAQMKHVDLKDAKGASVGMAMISPAKGGGVSIDLDVHGLPPGEHAIHFHAVPKCEAPFTSAGGHYDPGPAGNPDPDANHPYHMGDLPNLTVGADGKGQLDATTTRVTISDGPLTLADADGSAIIIHGNPDQGITGESKSGVSGGPRVACGVITKK